MAITAYPTRGVVTATDLSTDADVFPTPTVLRGQDFTMEKGLEFSTGVSRMSTGREIRTARMVSPRWNFNLQWNVLRDQNRVINGTAMAELAKLLGAFAMRLGKFGFFFYYDADEPLIVNQSLGFGDGSTKIFQLIRTVGTGIYTFVEPVYALWLAPVLKVNGVTKVYGTDYTVSAWGVVTFVTAPPNSQSITYSGTVMFVCAFDTDKLAVDQIGRGFWEQKGLPFYTLRP